MDTLSSLLKSWIYSVDNCLSLAEADRWYHEWKWQILRYCLLYSIWQALYILLLQQHCFTTVLILEWENCKVRSWSYLNSLAETVLILYLLYESFLVEYRQIFSEISWRNVESHLSYLEQYDKIHQKLT